MLGNVAGVWIYVKRCTEWFEILKRHVLSVIFDKEAVSLHETAVRVKEAIGVFVVWPSY